MSNNILDVWSVNPEEAKDLIKIALASRITSFIKGSPGCGKSSIVNQIAKEFGLEMIDIRLSLYDPTDLLGIPFRGEDKHGNPIAQHLPFDRIPLKGITDVPEGKKGFILFLDEYNHASPAVVRASHQIILDRRVGEYELHPKCWVICAGNLETDRALVNTLSTAVNSRLTHIYVQADFSQWFNDYALGNNINSKILAYLNFNKSSFNKFDPKSKESTFPCPRTWEALSKLLNIIERNDSITEKHLPLIVGTIGETTGYEFYTFTQLYKDLPTLENIVNDPENAIIPNDEASKYAIISTLSENINEEKNNVEAICKYMDRFNLSLITLFDILTIRRDSNAKLLLNKDYLKLRVKVGKALME